MSEEYQQQLACLYDIRVALGDKHGKLMQSEIVARVAELVAIESAAKMLFKVKGRHNSQLATCHLGELLGYPVVWPIKKEQEVE